jgi:TPR repeat protein
MLKNGEAVMADIEMAASAVEPADADACFALGMNYSAGAGVAVDLVAAHKWFNIAAMRGHRDAAQLRREIAEQMSDAEIGFAQRAARDWLKAHPQPQFERPAIQAAA